MELRIGLTGEVEIDKGGPGSGPRPGQGKGKSTAPPTPSKPTVRVSYSTVTPESAEAGDFADTGWHDEEGQQFENADEVANHLIQNGATEPSQSHGGPGTWYTADQGTTDYGTGETTQHDYHLSGLTPEEENHVFNRVTGRGHVVKIGLNGEVELVKGGPGSGPHPGAGRYAVQQKGPHGYKAHHVIDTKTGKTVPEGIHMNAETAATHAGVLNRGGHTAGEKGTSDYPQRESDNRASENAAAWDRMKTLNGLT